MCGRLDEDGGHLFPKCKHVKHVCAEMGLEEMRVQLAEMLGSGR